MKVLIGVDPHKASVAVAAVDEAKGELLERASFPQDRAGLRALERWAKRFPERRWAMENARGLGRHLAGRLAAAGESVVDVPPKLSAKVRVLSTSGNARKNDGLDALATALAASRNERLAAVDPEADSEVLRLLSERREDLVAERTTSAQPPAWALAGPPPRRGGREALGRSGRAHPARHKAPGRRLGPPPPAVGLRGAARRPDAGQEDRRPQRAHRSRGGRLPHHPNRDLRRRSHPGRDDLGDGRRRGALPDQGRTSPPTLARRRWRPQAGRWCATGSRWAGNRKLNYALHMVATSQARSDAPGGAYYRKKIAEGKSRKEALRCLKRRVCDAVFRSLVADSQAPSSSAA